MLDMLREQSALDLFLGAAIQATDWDPIAYKVRISAWFQDE